MKEQEISYLMHPRPEFNITFLAANELGKKLTQWRIANVLNLSRPLQINGIILLPTNIGYEDTNLELDMFVGQGILARKALNFYYITIYKGEEYFINAGFIQSEFAKGERDGYKAIKKLFTHARAGSVPEVSSDLLQEGASDRGGDFCSTSGQPAFYQQPASKDIN